MQLFKRPPRDESEEYFERGRRYRDRKNKEFNFALAVDFFKEAIKLNPDNSRYHGELGRTYVAAPLLAVTHGIGGVKVKECLFLGIEELKEALRLDHEYTEAYLVLGEAYRYLGENEKAVQAFKAVLQMPDVSFVGDTVIKSYAKKELKQLEQNENRQCQPDVAQQHLERAMLYRDEKKYRRAEMELGQALRLAPSWSWLYQTICNLMECR